MRSANRSGLISVVASLVMVMVIGSIVQTFYDKPRREDQVTQTHRREQQKVYAISEERQQEPGHLQQYCDNAGTGQNARHESETEQRDVKRKDQSASDKEVCVMRPVLC